MCIRDRYRFKARIGPPGAHSREKTYRPDDKRLLQTGIRRIKIDTYSYP